MPGKITAAQWPGGPGIRVDSHIEAGSVVPAFYDSLIGKIIAWAPDRTRAIARMRRALDETLIEGVPTTASFLRRYLDLPQFAK